MKQELTNSFGKVFITIEDDSRNRLINVNWSGYLTEDNIKTGAAAYIKALADAGYKAVLNDTRQIVGSWDHSLDWVLNEWAPQAARAGVRFFAMITTPESFADSTAATFYNKITSFQVKVFDNV